MKLSSASPFLRGYLEAALFTTDAFPPGGCDYSESGRADELARELPAWWVHEADVACRGFQEANAALLEKAGDDEQNGRDFWFSRNGHGVGFWDRGYPDEIGDALHDAAKAFGEHDLSPEDFGQVGDEWLADHGRAVTRNPDTDRWYFETVDSEAEQWASEEEFPSREEAAKACAAKGIGIKPGPKLEPTVAPRGKRSHRNGAPLSPARMAEVTPEILRRLKEGQEYVRIIQSMGVTAKTITLVKRANGLPVRGDVRDGKVFRGLDLAGREKWVSQN